MLPSLIRSPRTPALLSCLLAALLVWSVGPSPGSTSSLDPLYPTETSPTGQYRWSPPYFTLTAPLGRATGAVLLRQRMSAGPSVADTRPLRLRTAELTASFAVQGGAAPRVYTYLLPAGGRYLYIVHEIAPLTPQGTDRRRLGLAIFDSAVRPLDQSPWPPAVILLGALLAPLVALAFGWRGLGLLGGMLVIYLRAPALVLEPRLWAEEGSRYIAYAYGNPWYAALLVPQIGYFSLFNNIAAVVATHMVRVQKIPEVTTALAFAVQTIPLALILWGRCDLWRTPLQKIAAAAIVLFTPLSDEIWLNTINSQFHLALITFLILMEPAPPLGQAHDAWEGDRPRLRTWLYRLLLLVAGLTGAVSCFMAPLFILKSRLCRGREQNLQAIIISGCAVLQFFVALSLIVKESHLAARFSFADLPTLLSIIWIKTIVLPLSGVSGAQLFGDLVYNMRAAGRYAYWLLGGALLVVLVVGCWLFTRRLDRQKRLLLLGSYFLVTILSIISSQSVDKASMISASASQRYFYMPAVVLMLLIFSNITHGDLRSFSPRWIGDVSARHAPGQAARALLGKSRPALCLAMVGATLAFGVQSYGITTYIDSGTSRWGLEVARWRVDPEYLIEIRPQGWKMGLAQRER